MCKRAGVSATAKHVTVTGTRHYNGPDICQALVSMWLKFIQSERLAAGAEMPEGARRFRAAIWEKLGLFPRHGTSGFWAASRVVASRGRGPAHAWYL